MSKFQGLNIGQKKQSTIIVVLLSVKDLLSRSLAVIFSITKTLLTLFPHCIVLGEHLYFFVNRKTLKKILGILICDDVKSYD